MGRRTRATAGAVVLAVAVAACSTASDAGSRGAAPPPEVPRVAGVSLTADVPRGRDAFASWRAEVPAVEDVRIPSTADGEQQQALWLAPSGTGPQPLLVVLHSWSTRYVQRHSIPFAQWAQEAGWAMVAPDFRGAFDSPASGSDVAVQDVMDAVDWAVQQSGVDPDRVFPIGFSGGGLMSLLVAGRHPDRFAGAVSWVPIHDLAHWYRHARGTGGDRGYAITIRNVCDGDPLAEEDARRACDARSPLTHVDGARRAGLPVYIGAGLHDRTVPPDHAARAFDALARPGDRLGSSAYAALARGELPRAASGFGDGRVQSHFTDLDPDVVLARRSGPVTLVLFDGAHDMAYHPGLVWMTRQPSRGER